MTIEETKMLIILKLSVIKIITSFSKFRYGWICQTVTLECLIAYYVDVFNLFIKLM